MRTSVALLLLIALAGAARAEDPTEASLLAAWEAAQRADPKTVMFEHVGDLRYRFETARFPFKGELVVLNLSLEDVDLPGSESTVMGAVEVELVGTEEDFAGRHAYSYGAWQSGNVMYFDRDSERWLTSREWQRDVQQRHSPWSAALSIGNVLFFGLLAVLLLVLFRVSRKAGSQFKTATAMQERALRDQQESMTLVRRSLELAEDSNRVLHEILDELRAGRKV